MSVTINSRLSRHTWAQVRDLVFTLNPTIAEAIDLFDPSDDFTFYRVKYPYGRRILKECNFILPVNDNEYAPVTDPRFDARVREDLFYGPAMPTAFVLDKSLELFAYFANMVRPVMYSKKGALLGLLANLNLESSLDRNSLMNITAGARSLFMLQPIGEVLAHNRLMKHFDVQSAPPKQLLEQWRVFKEMTDYVQADWQAEVLVFSGHWFKDHTDIKYKAFKNALFEYAWEALTYHRYHLYSEHVLCKILTHCNLRADPNFINLLRQIIDQATGALPAFTFDTNNDMAPLELISQAYQDVYQLDSKPLFVGPGNFDYRTSSPMYNSLEIKNNAIPSIQSRKSMTRLDEIREVRRAFRTLREELLKNEMGLEDKHLSIIGFALHTAFEYFHADDVKDDIIMPATQAAQHDAFIKAAIEQEQFNPYSRFFWGCTQIRAQ